MIDQSRLVGDRPMSKTPQTRTKPRKPAKAAAASPRVLALRSQNWAIQALPGLNADNQAKLLEQGIATTFQLYRQTTTPEQRATLANQLQIHPQYIAKWAALADLSRLPSVGCDYCGLLLHAGIASPGQLAQMPFHQVHQQIVKLHVALLNQTDFCPSLGQVKQWVQEALLLHRSGQ